MEFYGITPKYDDNIDVKPLVCKEYGPACRDELRAYTMAGLYNAFQQMQITEDAYVDFWFSLEAYC